MIQIGRCDVLGESRNYRFKQVFVAVINNTIDGWSVAVKEPLVRQITLLLDLDRTA